MSTIQELTREYHVTARTLRHYEDLGILKPARHGQTRLYSDTDKERLEFTILSKSLGFALADLAELFELYDDSQSEETQLFRLIQLLRAKKRALEIKQTNLEIIKKQIEQYEQQCLQHIMDKGLIS